ncbi:GNAT family N-acetyltransferase [Brachybacterium vulturis]|uniref:GNAT family N-acetyltransferase n=1 Tax=Brachybacterium vulturis TaxID=2017484 RepID=UPI003736C642
MNDDRMNDDRMNDTDLSACPVLRRAALAEIDPRTLYLLAKLRQDVFAMEQRATDPDLDGRDLESGTTLMWLELPSAEAASLGLAGTPVAHLRMLQEPDGIVRIGRVAVDGAHRRSGYGRQLMTGALEHLRATAPGAVVHIDAQAYLEQWYAVMGFETVGELFMEAGIEHVAMVLRPSRA